MTLEQAVRIALPNVSQKLKHGHYDRVTRLTREYYRPMITGEGAEHLIRRFNMREDEQAYKQRLLLTQLITPAITNTLMSPARKVPKVKPVVDSATFGQGKAKEDEKFSKAIANFYAGKNVDHYFSSVLIDQSAIDPNAFCLVLFDDYNATFETAKGYPSIVSSADAWNFRYANGELIWLMVHRDIKYTEITKAEKGKKPPTGNKSDTIVKEGNAFWMYTDKNHVTFTQVDAGKMTSGPDGLVLDSNGSPVSSFGSITTGRDAGYYYRVSQNELYEVAFYAHNTGMVQAFRIGYVPDQSTKGETCVNMWHPALPYLLKGIKAGSELDLSAALHAFLQKIMYANRCEGYRAGDGTLTECNLGYEPSGTKCRSCNGSGLQVHRSGQDHITLSMPRTKDDLLPLAELVHYVQLPVEVLDWQDKYVDKLEQSCYRAVYNSDRFRASSSAVTATGEIIDLQAVYDALKPLADWYSQSRVLVYNLEAVYVSSAETARKSFTVAHEFPRNMRFETLAERVKLMGEMRTAGASSSALAQVNNDILQDLYIDDPRELLKAQVQSSFDPFLGKSESTIVSMISQDLTTVENKVLWTNFAYVFAECEERAGTMSDEDGKPVDFYSMARAKQQEMIDEVVEELIEEINEKKDAGAVDMGMGGDGEEEQDNGTGEGENADSPEDIDAEEPEGEGSGGNTDDLPDSPGARATE
jgi:hypothetical protein